MDRRQALAALASAPLIGITGRRRVGTSDAHELSGELDRLDQASCTAPPEPTLDSITAAYHRASDLLAAEPPHRVKVELCAVAGRLSVLGGVLAGKLGRYNDSRSWYTRARHRALVAGDAEATAWVYAHECVNPYYHGAYPLSATHIAERGLSFLNGNIRHPAASLLLLRAASSAAESGFRREACLLVEEAERAETGSASEPPSQLRLHTANQFRVAGGVFVELGMLMPAHERHQEAMNAYPGECREQRAAVMLNQALGLAKAEAIDSAATVATDTLARLPADQRSAAVRFTARRVASELRPWRGQPDVDTYLATVEEPT